MKQIKGLIFTFGFILIFFVGCNYFRSSQTSCDSDVSATKFYDWNENGAPEPLSFVAIGDNGCDCPAQREVADRMLKWHKKHPYDFVLMLGDNIYGTEDIKDGSRKLFKTHFDKYYKSLQDKGVKFHATLGNHDVKTRDGKEEINDLDRFGILGGEGYYSFTPSVKYKVRPLISFFSLNSNLLIKGRREHKQGTWLKEYLSKNKALWKVAFFHHPLYSPHSKHKADYGFRKYVEDTLVDGNINITLSGHNHIYARIKPQRNIFHFTSGGGGKQLYNVRMNEITSCASKSNHFMYFEVYPLEIRFWSIAAEGKIIDAGIIKSKKKRALYFK